MKNRCLRTSNGSSGNPSYETYIYYVDDVNITLKFKDYIDV